MATYGANVVTLSDIRDRLDPNGMLAKVIEVLNLENFIVEQIPWLEGNLPTGNQTTQRSSIPVIGTRALNSGVQPQKTTTKQVVDTCCLLEANSEIDREVLLRQNDPDGYRLSEDLGYAEGFRQKVANFVFYGDANSAPDSFNGLAVRYSTMVGAQKGNIAYQCIDAGGTLSVNTSAWFVSFGESSVVGIYPAGSTAGLTVQDMELQRLVDANGYPYWGYSTNMKWLPGIAVKNFRGVVRVCNIDTTNVATFGSGSDTSPNLIKFFILALNRIPAALQANLKIYVNELIYSYFQLMLIGKNSGGTPQIYCTTEQMQNGQVYQQLRFQGIPIYKCDALINAESRVV